jgi:hypothetical protein
MRAGIKDPIMIRRIETRSAPPAAVSPLFRALGSAGRMGSVSLMGLAVLLGALSCQSEGTPSVQAEPPKAQAPVASSPSVPASPSGQVGLAKYEEGKSGAASPSAAPAPEPGASAAAAPIPAADAPAKAAAGQTVQGVAVTEEPFSVWLQAVSPVAAGGPATVEAVLVAKPPYHCNAEYPHKFKLGAAPAGLSYPEATVKGAQVTAERSVLRIPVQAQSPGKATVSGTLQFSVCTDERCLVEKRDLALNLEVK